MNIDSQSDGTGSYTVNFTTSATGGLSLSGGSGVNIALPTGTVYNGGSGSVTFDGTYEGGCGGSGTSFSCGIGGTVGPNSQVSVTFSATNPPAGTYSLGLWTSSDTEPVESSDYQIGLTAPLSASSTGGAAPLSTQFSFTPADPTADTVNYTLEFGDGQATSGTDASPYQAVAIPHTYQDPGTYNATLLVTDADGQSATSTAQIVVQGSVAVVANAGGNLEGAVGVPLTFDGSASQPSASIKSYSWTFGDGKTGSGAIVNHTYSKTGTFTATLTVVAGGKSSSSKNR